MNDGTFIRRLNQLAAAKARYFKELEACEAEYRRRFGASPGEWDDEKWIDFAHGSAPTPTLMEIRDAALECELTSR